MKKKIRCSKCHFKPCRCEDLKAAYFGCASPKGWPMKSEALAVHPEDRGKAVQAAKKAGVPTYFDRMGRPVFRSQGHRKAYMQAFGYRDNNACYGDASGSSRETERQAMAREQRAKRVKEMTEIFLGMNHG